MLIVGIDIGSYFTTYAYSYEFEHKTFLKSAKYLSGFNLEKVIQNDTVYIFKKLLSLDKNTDPVPKNFMFLSEMFIEKDFLNEIRKFMERLIKNIPVDQDDTDSKYFIVSYPRGLLKQPISKTYLELICESITRGIRHDKPYKNAKVNFITDYEAFRQSYKELLFKNQKKEIIANSPPGTIINFDDQSLSKKYSKSLVLMNEKDSSILTGVDNKDFEKTYEEILDIDSIFNALNDIDVETYKTLYIDFGSKEIRFHYSEFINIIKPIKNTIVEDLTDILIEQYLSNFCYNLTRENQIKLRKQLMADVRYIILPKFTDYTVETYQHEFKYDMVHLLTITKKMINCYIQSSLLFDVIERIQENASSPIHKIELIGGFSRLYYHYVKNHLPELTINISNINISVGCVYYQQQLLEKEKKIRNKYRDAKIDCKNQMEKINITLEEEKIALYLINKEQFDFFQRQQEKQQQLIEKNANSPLSELDWVENDHKKDVIEQDQSLTKLIDKQKAAEERVKFIQNKIKKLEEFRDGLDKYYKNIVISFGNVSFDFFSSYSIVISSNNNNNNNNKEEEEMSSSSSTEQQSNDHDITKDKNLKILEELNISPTSQNNLYFKKLGLTLDDTISNDHKIKVIGSITDLNKALTTDNNKRTSNNNSPSYSSSSSSSSFSPSHSPLPSSNDSDHSISTFTMDKELSKSSQTNQSNSTVYSPSPISIDDDDNNDKNANLTDLNNKFISFNLKSDRIKRKTQLLEKNRILSSELKNIQTKNFSLNEEMTKVKQENQTLKSENQQLLQQIEELTRKLQVYQQT